MRISLNHVFKIIRSLIAKPASPPGVACSVTRSKDKTCLLAKQKIHPVTTLEHGSFPLWYSLQRPLRIVVVRVLSPLFTIDGIIFVY